VIDKEALGKPVKEVAQVSSIVILTVNAGRA
jgi:hypothetical protein